jgi:peptidoglycan/LPS O-acetylase OafA/YrhL
VCAPLIRAGFGYLAAGFGWDSERCAFAVYSFAPAHFDAFAIGALIALFRPEITADRLISRMTMVVAMSVIAVYVAVYGTLGVMRTGDLSSEAMRNIVSGIMFGQGREIFGYYVPIGISATILTGILSGAPGWLRVGRLPGLQAIGRVSYGGYMFHIPVLTVLGSSVPAFGGPANTLRGIIAHIGLFACAYSITVALAWLSFTFFEQRIARLGRRRR